MTANLRSYREVLRTGWGGTLTAAPDALREMLNLATGRLRLSGGKEAEFLRADTGDWTRTGLLVAFTARNPQVIPAAVAEGKPGPEHAGGSSRGPNMSADDSQRAPRQPALAEHPRTNIRLSVYSESGVGG